MRTPWFWAIGGGWCFLLASNGGEGFIHPAVTEFTITKTERTDSTEIGTLIYGHLTRPRPECNFREVRWYLGKRKQRNVPVAFQFRSRAQVRPDGKSYFGPWFVGTENVYTSHSDAYHQCTLFGYPLPWLTKSKLYN